MRITRTDIAKAFVREADKKSVTQAVTELAALLLENRMHDQVEELVLDIAKEYQEQHGVVEAEVLSAHILSTQLKQQLKDQVKKTTGAKKVILHEVVDPTLLGGMVLTAPDMELDTSLKTKLAKLKA